jgi:DNA-binding MarR family transcriptional regulator
MATKVQPPIGASVYLNVVRVHNRLTVTFSELFRRHGLTHAQYNVLRILRGAPKHTATCNYIGDQLVTRVPDVTRLLDRMEDAGLLARSRSEKDRRVVMVRLSAKGRKKVDELDEPVLDQHRRHFQKVKTKDLEALNAQLEKVLHGL